jgi:hypothetical protein
MNVNFRIEKLIRCSIRYWLIQCRTTNSQKKNVGQLPCSFPQRTPVFSISTTPLGHVLSCVASENRETRCNRFVFFIHSFLSFYIYEPTFEGARWNDVMDRCGGSCRVAWLVVAVPVVAGAAVRGALDK